MLTIIHDVRKLMVEAAGWIIQMLALPACVTLALFPLVLHSSSAKRKLRLKKKVSATEDWMLALLC